MDMKPKLQQDLTKELESLPLEEMDAFAQRITNRISLMSSLKLRFASLDAVSTPKSQSSTFHKQQSEVTQLNVVTEIPDK